MTKLLRGLLVVLITFSTIPACITMEQQYQARVEASVDRQLYSAFYPSPLPIKSGYDTQVYDDNIRITQRIGTVDFVGEAERKYLSEIEKTDPVLDTYVSVATKRGGKIKVYKSILNQKLFASAGVLDYWPEYRKTSKEDQAYLEFDPNGRLRSAMIRRAAFSKGSLGIGVYREHFIVVGGAARAMENRISNRDLGDAYLRDVSSQ